jgi:hypothetical protein
MPLTTTAGGVPILVERDDIEYPLSSGNRTQRMLPPRRPALPMRGASIINPIVSFLNIARRNTKAIVLFF